MSKPLSLRTSCASSASVADSRRINQAIAPTADDGDASSPLISEALHRVRTQILATLRSEVGDEAPVEGIVAVAPAEAEIGSHPARSLDDLRLPATTHPPAPTVTPHRLSAPPAPVRAAFADNAVFDSSRKQRVQSWTDRILWKSTMVVDEADDRALRLVQSRVAKREEAVVDDVAERGSRQSLWRRRPSQMLSIPRGKLRRASEGGILTRRDDAIGASPRHGQRHVTQPSRYQAHVAGDSSEAGDYLATLRRPPGSPATLRIALPPLEPPRRPFAGPASAGPLHTRPSPGCEDALPPSLSLFRTLTHRTTRHTEASGDAGLRSSMATAGWRSWWNQHMPAFLASLSTPHGEDEAMGEVPIERIGPRPNEVVCLSYHSVSDLARMQALSDHRPVVGIFAIGLPL
jgi:hypothetical protein